MAASVELTTSAAIAVVCVLAGEYQTGGYNDGRTQATDSYFHFG